MAAPDELQSLLDICHDPTTCTPQLFDFYPHLKDGQKDDQPERKKPRKGLPRRLLLSAFSTAVGHRPTGLQAAQAKLFVERFKSDFKEMSMQKTVLPCSADGLPFVAPDGSLPCPSLSTFNALKYLQEKPEELARAEPGAKA